MIYPIAEIFHSLQGEGFWTGTPMMFVRLAGCNVGKYAAKAPDGLIQHPGALPFQHLELPLYTAGIHSICTTSDGQKFLCDTNYHTALKLSDRQIVKQLHGEHHVCITGGEPMLHDLDSLIEHFTQAPDVTMIHIETSGTLEWTADPDEMPLWITCCPKKDCRFEEYVGLADEWKLLVGPDFNLEQFEKLNKNLTSECDSLYLQPINGIEQIWKENVRLCLDLLTKYPNWKLSAQLHKYLEVR